MPSGDVKDMPGKLEPAGASTVSDSDIEEVAVGEINEKRLIRKLDARLLPAVSTLYLLSFLDRSNGKPALRSWRVSFAKVLV